VKLGQGNNWGCPLCDFLDLTKGNEYDHWEFGECVTCLLKLGKTITFLALKVALKKYVDEPELLTRDEFAAWANYFHYLEEQKKEVETWNCLLWYMLYERPPATMEPWKLVHWTCTTQLGNKVCNKHNVLMFFSTCSQVPPPHIKWLVDHNPAKLFSRRFTVKGILKKTDGTWIDNKDWLRLNRPNYDASYQITALTEKQAAEQLYLYQQAARLVELREKTAHTMCGIVTWNEGCHLYDPPMPIQDEAPREYLEPYMMNCKLCTIMYHQSTSLCSGSSIYRSQTQI
jgi:hypothetical protein